MSRQKVLADREQVVAKSNTLIRKARYELTTQQQKLVLFAISKIKPDDDSETVYSFNVKDFADACGIKIRDGGSYFQRIRDDMLKLTERSLQIFPDGSGMTISWIGDFRFPKGSSLIEYWFNPNIKQYLFALREHYTQYPVQNVLVFGRSNSIRLYEILRSYTTRDALDFGIEKDVEIALSDLKAQLGIKTYDKWSEFNRCILRPAVDEINERADDIHIEYEPLHGEHTRSITKINFIITRARGNQQYKARRSRKRELDGLPY